MEELEILSRGGVYLARLDPTKAAEVGKIRPIVILNTQTILEVNPPVIFICPLSSQSKPAFSALHVEIPARDNLNSTSFALTEHCRSITTQRIIKPRIAQLTAAEIEKILERLKRLVGIR